MKKLLSIVLGAVMIVSAFAAIPVSAKATPASITKKVLISKKWNCYACVVKGKKKTPADQYGSVVKTTGAYIKFSQKGSFKCVLGLKGISGKYTVDKKGFKVTLKITKKWSGEDSKPVKINKTKTLKVAENRKKIAVTLWGARNYFKQ